MLIESKVNTSGIIFMQKMTSEQVRAARALLRWEQNDLSQASGLSLPTVKRLETKPGYLTSYQSSVDALHSALEAAGIEFIGDGQGSLAGGSGVRLKQQVSGSVE